MSSHTLPVPELPDVPLTSPSAIVALLWKEYGDNPRCGHCNSALPPRNLFGIPSHYTLSIEKIVARTIAIYQSEIDRANLPTPPKQTPVGGV